MINKVMKFLKIKDYTILDSTFKKFIALQKIKNSVDACVVLDEKQEGGDSYFLNLFASFKEKEAKQKKYVDDVVNNKINEFKNDVKSNVFKILDDVKDFKCDLEIMALEMMKALKFFESKLVDEKVKNKVFKKDRKLCKKIYCGIEKQKKHWLSIGLKLDEFVMYEISGLEFLKQELKTTKNEDFKESVDGSTGTSEPKVETKNDFGNGVVEKENSSKSEFESGKYFTKDDVTRNRLEPEKSDENEDENLIENDNEDTEFVSDESNDESENNEMVEPSDDENEGE